MRGDQTPDHMWIQTVPGFVPALFLHDDLRKRGRQSGVPKRDAEEGQRGHHDPGMCRAVGLVQNIGNL